MKLEEILIEAAYNWIRDTNYKLPPPSGPNIKEIHVPAILVPISGCVDTLIFDAKTQKLKAILFDVYDYKSREKIYIRRIDLP